MAYNFSFKRYASGTIQLTYYDNPIMDSYDKYVASYDSIEKPFEYHPLYFDDDTWTPWGDVEKWDYIIEEDRKNDNKNKISNFSDEELAERHKRSIESSLNRTIRRVYDLGRNNNWDWFFTLTLNEKAVKDRKDYVECATKINNWCKNVKKRLCPNMKYIIVPELHPTSGAWHFHALVSDCDELEFKVAINQQPFRIDKETREPILDKNGNPIKNKYYGQQLRTSYPDGDYIYNIVNFNEERYGFTEATRVKDTKKVVSYIIKYLTKELTESAFGKKRYFASKNLTVPERETALISKGSMDDVINFIETKYNVKLSSDFIKTVYINTETYSNTVSYLEFDNVSQNHLPDPGAAVK